MPQKSTAIRRAIDIVIPSLSLFLFASVKKTSGEGKIVQIPRVHPPGMATSGREFAPWDGFSLGDTNNGDFTDNPESSASSSSSAYNTTYRTTGTRAQPDFALFDDLEKRTPIAGGNIPRRQSAGILGTLNSIPPDLSATANTFSDVRDLNEIELVTDMLDDMTKDDDFEDDFAEAFNPFLAMPRAAEQSETRSPGWFSVRDDEMDSTIDC